MLLRWGEGAVLAFFFCAQKAELIWHSGAETDLFNFQCTDIEVTEPSVQGR